MRKLSTGNHFGYYKGHSVFIYKRFHGKWCAEIKKGGKLLYSEGYFGTSLRTITAAKKWAKNKINRYGT